MGSSVFFEGMQDYEKKDNDFLAIMDTFFPGKTMMRVKIGDDDIFMFRNGLSKEDYIKDTLDANVPMRVGKFLIPEFAEFIDFGIEELKQFEPLIKKLDDKHKYEEIIYNAYLENGKFELTEEQRKEAYKEYKKAR